MSSLQPGSLSSSGSNMFFSSTHCVGMGEAGPRRPWSRRTASGMAGAVGAGTLSGSCMLGTCMPVLAASAVISAVRPALVSRSPPPSSAPAVSSGSFSAAPTAEGCGGCGGWVPATAAAPSKPAASSVTRISRSTSVKRSRLCMARVASVRWRKCTQALPSGTPAASCCRATPSSRPKGSKIGRRSASVMAGCRLPTDSRHGAVAAEGAKPAAAATAAAAAAGSDRSTAGAAARPGTRPAVAGAAPSAPGAPYRASMSLACAFWASAASQARFFSASLILTITAWPSRGRPVSASAAITSSLRWYST
ncbi:hypothetical protein F751_6966 [Auxenochlorella protothecoides]|uniref:Uncharacterized protein n=1 Tax=Auxenochlorella protothecoides TaxID=3075 RepID=A0A087SR45_AUXPR|nr:hypothetical protein F751_6966 [Auxenochlorella protothecoides]KFM28199.1 hypothetical protein F751_6966 [Auxenochlorella protothecoides]